MEEEGGEQRFHNKKQEDKRTLPALQAKYEDKNTEQ